MTPKTGQTLVVEYAGKREVGKVILANDRVAILDQGAGFSLHVRYDANLGAWRVGGAKATFEKFARWAS